jgi:hypothetical protein
VAVNCRSDVRLGVAEDALDPTGPRRLDVLGAAPGNHRLAQSVLAQLDRADLVGQPGRQPVLVLNRRLPEAHRRPHLGAVVLDGATGPGVSGEQPGVNADLLRDVVNG